MFLSFSLFIWPDIKNAALIHWFNNNTQERKKKCISKNGEAKTKELSTEDEREREKEEKNTHKREKVIIIMMMLMLRDDTIIMKTQEKIDCMMEIEWQRTEKKETQTRDGGGDKSETKRKTVESFLIDFVLKSGRIAAAIATNIIITEKNKKDEGINRDAKLKENWKIISKEREMHCKNREMMKAK